MDPALWLGDRLPALAVLGLALSGLAWMAVLAVVQGPLWATLPGIVLVAVGAEGYRAATAEDGDPYTAQEEALREAME